MNLRELGEFGFIETLRRHARASRAWRVGIGDDAALLRPLRGEDVVLTADALIENVHFRWRTTDPRSLGAKSLAVNLSDLGAMGARPLGFLLTLGLPARARSAQLSGFFAGLLALARRSDCPLVGGDTVRAPVWTIALTAVGAVRSGRALLRSGAQVGDRVFVTGRLGAAAAGLSLLEKRAPRGAPTGALVRAQLAPRPPWRVGPRLAHLGLAHAAIDVSDGLAQDLGHVARASGVRIELDRARIPIARGATLALALAGGEDYELAFSAPARSGAADTLSRRLGSRVTEIGRVVRGQGVALLEDGRMRNLPRSGFDHFKRTVGRSEK